MAQNSEIPSNSIGREFTITKNISGSLHIIIIYTYIHYNMKKSSKTYHSLIRKSSEATVLGFYKMNL